MAYPRYHVIVSPQKADKGHNENAVVLKDKSNGVTSNGSGSL